MSIVYARLNRLEERVSRDDSGVKITQPWQVWGDSSSTALDAILYTDIPQYGEAYSSGSFNDLRVRNSSVSSVDLVTGAAPNGSAADVLYVVNVEFGLTDFSISDPDPISRPAEIRWSGSTLTEVMMKDWDDVAYKNSAGDMYDPLEERYIQSADCTITMNEETNPATRCVNFSWTTNDAIIWGVAIGNALIKLIESQKTWEIVNGVTQEYWRTTYPISFRNDNWKSKVIDNGFNYLDGGTKRPIVVTDTNGNKHQVTTPQLLNGSGATTSTPTVYPTGGFKKYNTSNFASLNLPNPFL